MMAAATTLSTKGLNKHSIIPALICISLVFSIGIRSAPATPVKRAYSCGSLRSMARVYMASGGYEKAQPFLVKALNLARETNASDSEMSACMLDLAYLYKNQGRLVEAETICLSGLELQEKAYSQSHPYVAYTLRILSEIYRMQARYSEAVNTLERALTIVRGYSLEDDQELAPFKVDMARLLAAQGDYIKAESYFSEAMVSIEKNYGPNHLYTTKVLCSMAALYVFQERYADAEELVSRVLPIQQRIYGPDHHFLVPVWLIKSSIYEAEGDFVNTKALLDKSLDSLKDTTGTGYAVECDVLSRLGEYYILSKEFTKAEDVLQQALGILGSAKGTNTDREAIVLNNLAKVYINQDKYSNAQNLCGKALEILENIFDEYHPYVADVLETQIQLYRETGNMTEAARLEQRAEEIRVRKKVAYAPIARATN
jgi:tetratricopeptide (TPR) repeat protein